MNILSEKKLPAYDDFFEILNLTSDILENEDECYRFFEDIATINELKSLAQRMQVAKMLKEKKVYTEIAEATGASTATISRVNKCLNYGEEGYNLVLNRLYPESK